MATTGHESEAINVQGLKASLQKLKTDHIDGKADKATTLAGYGITDAYTKSETYTKTEVNGLVDTPHQNYVTVSATSQTTAATDVLPASGQAADTIYRVSNWDGSASSGAGAFDVTKYSEYAWDDQSNPNKYVFLCVKTAIGEVFDISVYNNNATYADLAAALGVDGANVPADIRRGGMSVKFVHSSDKKYVQYRLMLSTFTVAQFTDTANWQRVDITDSLIIDEASYKKWNDIHDFAGWLFDNYISLGNGYTIKVIPVNGCKTLTIYSNAATYYSLVKSFSSIISNTPYDFATGETQRRYIAASKKQVISIPNDAKYILISSLLNNVDVAPYSLLVDNYDIIDGSTKELSEAKTETGNIKQEIGTLSSLPFYYLQIFGTFYDSNFNFKSKYICVNGGETFIIKAGTSLYCRAAILKSFNTNINSRTNFDFATGYTEAIDVLVNTEMKIVLPADAKFIVFTYNNNGTDSSPVKLLINDYNYVDTVRDNLIRIASQENGNFTEKIELQQGGINSDTGEESDTSKRVRTNLLKMPFSIKVNSGFKIYIVAKYRQDGTFVECVDHSNFDFENYDGCAYRLVFAKTDITVDISPSDNIIKSNLTGLDYKYNNKTALHAKELTDDKASDKLIPYTRGTGHGNDLSYDASANYERFNLLFMTDSHTDYGDYIHQSFQNFIDTIDFANNSNNDIHAVMHGGDIVTKIFRSGDVKAQHIANLTKVFNEAKKSSVPFLYTKGNHDLNNMEVAEIYSMQDSDWSDVWYDYAESNYGLVRQTKQSGDKSTWYYKDFESFKLRIISLDCYDVDKTYLDSNGVMKYWGSRAQYISNEQMNWLVSTALNFDSKEDKGWGVIVFMHYYRASEVNGTDVEPIFESIYPKLNSLLAAFNTQATYSEQYTFERSFFDLDIDADWTRYANLDSKPFIVGVISGHTHCDGKSEQEGIINIWTANALCGENAADTRIKRVPGTTTQNLFDIINIDLKERKIRCIRYGAGITNYGQGGDRFLPDGLGF